MTTVGIKAVDPQSIRNVTIVGEPAETSRVVRRLLGDCGGAGAVATRHRIGRVEHTVRVTELSGYAPIADLERSLRVADGVVVVLNAAVPSTPRFETILRVADDHQVARLCLMTGLDRRGADFDRGVRAITGTRGARPLRLQLPLGIGPGFDGVIDLVPMWALEPMAAEFYGSQWKVAEQWYRDLVAAVGDQDLEGRGGTDSPRLALEQLHDQIRRVTRLGEAVPVLCDVARSDDDNAVLLDAVVRYLPSPMLVCQPEHALDY